MPKTFVCDPIGLRRLMSLGASYVKRAQHYEFCEEVPSGQTWMSVLLDCSRMGCVRTCASLLPLWSCWSMVWNAECIS